MAISDSYDQDPSRNYRTSRGGKKQARLDKEYAREMARPGHKGMRKPGDKSNIRNPEQEKKDYESLIKAQRASLDVGRASQGIPRNAAEKEVDKREQLNLSGAFGSKAQNLAQRRALFEDMKKGGDAAELRQRAAKLGVDDKGYDIAQARLAKERRPTMGDTESTSMGQTQKPATGGMQQPALGGIRPMGGMDAETNKVFGDQPLGTAGSYLNDFEKAARETEMPEQADIRMEREKKEADRLALNKSQDERIAADAARTANIRKEAGIAEIAGSIKLGELGKQQEINKQELADTRKASEAKIAQAQQNIANREQMSAIRNEGSGQIGGMAARTIGLVNPLTAPAVIGEGLYNVAQKLKPTPDQAAPLDSSTIAAQERLQKTSQEASDVKSRIQQMDTRQAAEKEKGLQDQAVAKAQEQMNAQVAKEKTREEEELKRRTEQQTPQQQATLQMDREKAREIAKNSMR